MPSKPNTTVTPVTPVIDDDWNTVAEARTKMIFDTDGDEFTGYFEGPEIITNPNTGEDYNYLNFRDDSGTGFTTSASYQLSRAFKDMPVGTFVRITRLSMSKVDKGNMTNYRVQVRKSGS